MIKKVLHRLAHYIVKNWYEAADKSRLRPKRVDQRTPDQQLRASQPYLLDRARHLDQNNDIIASVANELQGKIWGANGLTPEFQVKLKNGDPAQAVNEHFHALFTRWARMPFTDGEDSYISGQALLGNTWLRDGEVFCRMHTGNVRGLEAHVPEIPLWLEMLESEECPDYNDESRNVVQGVEKNEWRRPVRYYFRKLDNTSLWRQQAAWSPSQLVAVDADMVNHIKIRRRIRQTRGVSYFATIMNRVIDIAEIDETERAAARVAAAVALQITKGTPDQYDPTLEDDDREFEVAPGMVYKNLLQGEKLEILDSKRPNPDLVGFRDSQLRHVAGGTNTTYSAISRNYGQLSYSSARQERLEGIAGYRFLSNFWIARQEEPVVKRFIQLAWLTVPVRWQNQVDTQTLYDISYTLPGIGYLNPLQEVQADIMAVTGGENGVPLTSWQKTVRRRGENPNEVLQQILAERELLQDIRESQVQAQSNEDSQASEDNQGSTSNLRIVK